MISKYDLVIRKNLNWIGIVLDVLEEDDPILTNHSFIKIFWFDVMFAEECNSFLVEVISESW